MSIPSLENPPGASLPAVTVVELTDPTAVGENIEILRQDLVQLDSTPLRARQVYVRLKESLVIYQSTNVRMRVRVTAHDLMWTYSVFGPQAGGAINGLPVGPHRMLAAAPGKRAELVVEAGYESVANLITPDLLAAHLRRRQRAERLHLQYGIKMLTVDEGCARRLFDWGKRLAAAAADAPGLFDDGSVQDSVQGELLELLLATLDTTVSPGHSRCHQAHQARTRVVRLAEEHALAHIDDRLYVTDLCIAAGVSERTLQYAFQEVMGMSPLAYLTRLRLHRVRKALRLETNGSTTVSAQALRWGFWHFGDFSRAYRDCFGELPSETLRRKPLEIGVLNTD